MGTSTINSAGGADYTTLQAWWNAVLTSFDEEIAQLVSGSSEIPDVTEFNDVGPLNASSSPNGDRVVQGSTVDEDWDIDDYEPLEGRRFGPKPQPFGSCGIIAPSEIGDGVVIDFFAAGSPPFLPYVKLRFEGFSIFSPTGYGIAIWQWPETHIKRVYSEAVSGFLYIDPGFLTSPLRKVRVENCIDNFDDGNPRTAVIVIVWPGSGAAEIELYHITSFGGIFLSLQEFGCILRIANCYFGTLEDLFADDEVFWDDESGEFTLTHIATEDGSADTINPETSQTYITHPIVDADRHLCFSRHPITGYGGTVDNIGDPPYDFMSFNVRLVPQVWGMEFPDNPILEQGTPITAGGLSDETVSVDIVGAWRPQTNIEETPSWEPTIGAYEPYGLNIFVDQLEDGTQFIKRDINVLKRM